MGILGSISLVCIVIILSLMFFPFLGKQFDRLVSHFKAESSSKENPVGIWDILSKKENEKK